MSKKAPKPLKIAPLQGVIAEPMDRPGRTGRDGQAAQQASGKQGGRKGKANGDEPGGASNSAAKRREKNTPFDIAVGIAHLDALRVRR